MKSIDGIIEQSPNVTLTAEEITFARLIERGIPYTTAYRKAFPLKAKLSYDYIRRKAVELAEKSEIRTEVATAAETRATLTRLAEDRLTDTLLNGKPGMATNQVAMFLYDHANGKATQSVNMTANVVSLSVNLSDVLRPKPTE